MSYKEDRAFGDKYLSTVIEILEKEFSKKEINRIVIAPEYEDKKNNADILIYLLCGAPIKISVRVRKYKKYNCSITMRSVGTGGTIEVEWKKMKEGAGDYFIYLRESKDETTVDRYVLVDLDVIREFTECSRDAPTLSSTYYNDDGSGCIQYNLLNVYEYDPRVIVGCTSGTFKNFILGL